MAEVRHGSSDGDKCRIACDFLLHAAPGEFNEVFNDVRLLLNNEQLVRDSCTAAVAQYNKDQFMPVRLNSDGAEVITLVTHYNDLGGGRFYDPKSGLSFRYDHLRKEASDPTKADPPAMKAETWRRALQKAADTYASARYRYGVATVFGRIDAASALPALCLCIESHRFQPKNYWNGRWRSQWATVVGGNPAVQQHVELKGQIKVHVHCYEDGNVQLVSSKEVTARIQCMADASLMAKEIMKLVQKEETAYQAALNDNYKAMSDTTFGLLRTQHTEGRLDWSKFTSKVGHAAA